jgi:hypothetical protein
MTEPEAVPKRNMSVPAAVFMLCLGGLALLFSKVRARRKAKAKEGSKE